MAVLSSSYSWRWYMYVVDVLPIPDLLSAPLANPSPSE